MAAAYRSFPPLSGSVGVHFRATDELSTGLTVSVAQRAPSALELFAGGPHEASSTFERGNTELDEETSFGSWIDRTGRPEAGR